MKSFFAPPQFSLNQIRFWSADFLKTKNQKPNLEKGSKPSEHLPVNRSGKRKIIMIGRGRMGWADVD